MKERASLWSDNGVWKAKAKILVTYTSVSITSGTCEAVMSWLNTPKTKKWGSLAKVAVHARLSSQTWYLDALC